MQTKPQWIKACEAIMAGMLAIMVVLVFGNVVLRYGFNSGIVSSEETARFLFVWLTFVGAIVAMRENAHLGVDSLVRMANTAGKKWLYGISSVLMLGCCVLLFIGSVKQTQINRSVNSSVLEIPMAWLYGAGVVASAGIGFIIALNLYKLLTGSLADSELVQTSDSEEIGADGEMDVSPSAKTAKASKTQSA
jgi:TRAP-type C4-dicarboxylate transport system permease small subunit